MPKITVERSSVPAVGGTFSGAITTSGGVVPATSGFTCWYTGGAGNTLNASSGTNKTLVAGTIYWAQVFIPINCTLTGIIFTTGATGGTDSWVGALYNASGTLVANSALAGTVAPSANTKKRFPFTSTYSAIGPATYYIALQSNGTTATALMFGNVTEGFVTGSVAGSFGTLPAITPGTDFNSTVGAFASTY